VQLLPDGLRLRIHLYFVLDYLPRDTRHVYRLPGKHVSVVPQELDERAFLFGSEAGADGRCFAFIGEAKVRFLISSTRRMVVVGVAYFIGIMRSFPNVVLWLAADRGG
jgi:hypothetical protein